MQAEAVAELIQVVVVRQEAVAVVQVLHLLTELLELLIQEEAEVVEEIHNQEVQAVQA
jgi:hypothetical protein